MLEVENGRKEEFAIKMEALKQRSEELSRKETQLTYQKFLESVLETTEQFGEVKDIISRFDTLAATIQELIDHVREAQDRTERDRATLINSTEVVKPLPHPPRLRCETLELGQIKMAATNMFSIVKTHLNSKLETTTDTMVQLDKIQQFMIDLNAISAELTQGAIGVVAGGTKSVLD
ncbi:UNVERIFIED_CONTAM: Cilia- and flagella-associated protein 73 [Siphonaria sp. JEL0065]|nr:Cilia- and flagella-associated protein 73 [Siphonaria sp. JEL0065]